MVCVPITVPLKDVFCVTPVPFKVLSTTLTDPVRTPGALVDRGEKFTLSVHEPPEARLVEEVQSVATPLASGKSAG
jgi:hypothetical protein